MNSVDDVLDLENKEYVWRRQDIELYRLLPCQGSNQICVTVAHPGEKLVRQQLDSVPVWWKMPYREKR
jgi:hypothetical protein